MNTIWCPVRLVSRDPSLIANIQSICVNLRASDFAYFDSLSQNHSNDSLAQIVLIDLAGPADDSPEQELAYALKRIPRDVVVGIGAGFRGSTIAHWARQGMHSLVDSPLREQEFAMTMQEANRHCVNLRIEQSELRMLCMQRKSITKREEQVLDLVVQGIPNKCIASKLDVSQRTIESRRQKIYQKMNAKRLTDLIRALDKLEFLSKTLNADVA